MIGIYKITNKINGNSYIGLSVNIHNRWNSHCERYKDATNKEYDKVLYQAFRKYGIKNFKWEVLEECKTEQLPEREKYWIAYYDTYYHGYNCTPGGEQTGLVGEKHPNHKITEQDVIYIRKLWASKTVSTQDMYYEYKDRIGKSGFKKIYTWQTWKKILPELNTEENRLWHRNNTKSYSNPGEKNPNSHITDKMFQDIKKRWLNDEPPRTIYKDYKNYYSNYESFYATNHKRTQKEIKPVSTIPVVGE